MFLLLRPRKHVVLTRTRASFGLVPRILRWPAKVAWWLFDALLRGIPDILRNWLGIPALVFVLSLIFHWKISTSTVEDILFVLGVIYVWFFRPTRVKPKAVSVEDGGE